MKTEWHVLTCPYCGKAVESPLFSEGAEQISHKMTHLCGVIYCVDRSDRRTKRAWEDIQQKSAGDWKIVHNYHIQIGKIVVILL